ncbi:hypothetical protein GBAR_LOCUS12376, partial [Geodia barretti]
MRSGGGGGGPPAAAVGGILKLIESTLGPGGGPRTGERNALLPGGGNGAAASDAEIAEYISVSPKRSS